MTIAMSCPACGTKLNIDEKYAGQEGRCRGCNEVFRVPNVASQPIARARVPEPPLVRAEYVEARPPEQVQRAEINVTHKTGNPAPFVLGLLAVLMSIGALLISWIPLLGFVAVPVAGIAGLLAGIGLVIALTNQRQGMAMPIVGGVLAGLAIAVAIFINAVFFAAVEEANERTRTQRQNSPFVQPFEP